MVIKEVIIMKESRLYLIWGALFIVCAGFGFILRPGNAMTALMVSLSAAFFVPPSVLLYGDWKGGKKTNIRRVRNLSIASLSLTLIAIIANVLSVYASKTVGDILHGFWVIVSAPMVCSRFGVVSVFAWACLLMTSLKLLKGK